MWNLFFIFLKKYALWHWVFKFYSAEALICYIFMIFFFSLFLSISILGKNVVQKSVYLFSISQEIRAQS